MFVEGEPGEFLTIPAHNATKIQGTFGSVWAIRRSHKQTIHSGAHARSDKQNFNAGVDSASSTMSFRSYNC